MRKSGYIVIAMIAVSLVLDASSVQAQSASRDAVPAEFPPASFSGRQYVDSRGCVFIRAGVDGNVSWVPRVSRDRKMICGFQPSLSQVAAAEPAPEPAPAARTQAPTQAAQAATATTQTRTASTTAATTRATAATTPAATTGQTATTATRPTATATATPTRTQATQARVVRAQPQPQSAPAAAPATPEPQQVRVVSAAPTTTATVARPAEMAPRQTACRGASAISQRYMVASNGVAVRCGPQQRPHVTVISGGNARNADRNRPAPMVIPQAQAQTQAQVIMQPAPLPRSAATTAITRQTRVVPKSVYENQIASTRGVYIPEGYRAVWDDDRLSTTRMHQTVGGMADMEIAWTNTVPRLLVERETGREVTYLFPGLMYPYTSYAQQNAARATVSTRGAASRDVSMMGRHQRDGVNRQSVGTARASIVAGASASADMAASTVSTRSAVTVRVPQQPPSHRYVQVGVFADQGHARREAQRIANSGLPTRLGAMSRNGTSYGVVISGPFNSQSSLQSALNRVRGMGFNHAKLRK